MFLQYCFFCFIFKKIKILIMNYNNHKINEIIFIFTEGGVVNAMYIETQRNEK